MDPFSFILFCFLSLLPFDIWLPGTKKDREILSPLTGNPGATPSHFWALTLTLFSCSAQLKVGEEQRKSHTNLWGLHSFTLPLLLCPRAHFLLLLCSPPRHTLEHHIPASLSSSGHSSFWSSGTLRQAPSYPQCSELGGETAFKAS